MLDGSLMSTAPRQEGELCAIPAPSHSDPYRHPSVSNGLWLGRMEHMGLE